MTTYKALKGHGLPGVLHFGSGKNAFRVNAGELVPENAPASDIAAFLKAGYIAPTQAEPAPSAQAAATIGHDVPPQTSEASESSGARGELMAKTVVELREIAAKHELSAPRTWTKSELVDQILAKAGYAPGA